MREKAEKWDSRIVCTEIRENERLVFEYGAVELGYQTMDKLAAELKR